MDTAANEYQVCYKCHSVRNMANPVVTRDQGDNNIAHEFAQTNASFHPVEGQGRSTDVPSLLQGLNTTSIIYCSGCHGSDNANGPQGPHGSVYRPILRAQYETRDMTFESPQAYALCYSCHSRASILADESFRFHKLHVVDSKTACATCHDPHGVEQNTHLINFDTLVVQPAATGMGPGFTDLGVRRGACTLSCHGKEHDNLGY
jgi:hypothetical protein